MSVHFILRIANDGDHPTQKGDIFMSNENSIGISFKDVTDAAPAPLPLAPPDSVGFSAERLNRVVPAMQAEIDAGHYAGISVMIARHGKLVKTNQYGFQALGSSEPLREDAIY